MKSLKSKKLMAGLLVIGAFLFSTQPSNGASQSKIRIFEAGVMTADGLGRMATPRCLGVGCRYIEIEVTNDSLLSVRNCAIEDLPVTLVSTKSKSVSKEARTETLPIDCKRLVTDVGNSVRSPYDSPKMMYGADHLPSGCTNLISNYEMTPALRTRLQKQIGRRAFNPGQTLWSAATTSYWTSTALVMGLLTYVAAPDHFAFIFGA